MFSDKTFIVHVYALEISCLCPYRKVKSPKMIRLTSDYLRFCIVYGTKNKLQNLISILLSGHFRSKKGYGIIP